MAEQDKPTTQPKPKHAGGRPTKLTRELVDKAAAYVLETDNFYPGSLLPTVERLSLILNVDPDTLYDWSSKEDPTPLQQEISEILKRLKRTQADKLVQLGLAGKYNPVITKLMLTKHDYSDKSTVEEKSEQTVTVITRAHDD